MTLLLVRWRPFGAVTAAVVALMVGPVGCSSGSSRPHATTQPSSSSPQPAATADSAAAVALAKAIVMTKALRSYAFQATQRLTGAAAPQLTSLSGRAVRPAAISYDLRVGGKDQQVIKLGGRTYVRQPPAPWTVLAKPGATVDPLASLLPLLTGLTAPTLTGHRLSGQVPASVLTQARLAPPSAAPNASTPVTFGLDPTGHISSVTLRVTVRAGARTLVLDEATTFSLFNRAPAIKAPGIVRR